MLIPLGTDRPLRRASLVTPALVGLTVAAFLAQVLGRTADPGAWGRIESALAVVGGPGFRPWQLVTSAFLHADAIHLLGNMLFLWVFGRAVEDRLGRVGFLVFYLLAACASGAAHALVEKMTLHPAMDMPLSAFRELPPTLRDALLAGRSVTVWIPAIGASGAVAGVTGAFLVLFPRTRIRVFLWFFLIGRYEIPAWVFIVFQILWNLFGVSGAGDSNVAYVAHLAGYAFGFGVAFLLLWTRRLPRETYDLFTLARQAKRRREIREAYEASRRTAPERRRAAEGAAGREGPEADRLAELRAEVGRAVAAERLDEAAEAYRRLEEAFGGRARAATLPRNHQFALANHLYRAERYAEAARAYERFLEAYPTDRDADSVRLLLARVYAHALGRAGDARPLLERVAGGPEGDELRALAEAELAELGRGGAEEGR